MKTGGIGRLVGELRKEAKIPQKKLCKGLCSVQLLSKIELEERTPDMLLLEVLMQRLGKSAEKLEIILSMEEYLHIMARDEIEDALRFGKLGKAEELLNTYLKKYEHEGIMQLMYGYRMRGALAIERKEYAIAEVWLRKAVSLSILEDNWCQLKGELLSIFELENIVLLCQTWSKYGKTDEAKIQLEQLHLYVKECIVDQEELVKIQSKIASILGEIYNREERYDDCIALCEPVFELERDLLVLQCMSLLMNNLSVAYEHTKNAEKLEKICRWKKHLETIYEMQNLSVDIVNGMYFNFYARQYYLDCELIRGERLRQGLTQAELAEGIYECVESLSRVENGKESPNRIKFQQLMERLGIDKSRYNGNLATNEYKVMEIDVSIEKFLIRKEYELAKKEIEYLEGLIDLSEIQNIQLMQRRKNMILEIDKNILAKEVKERAEKLLQLTYDIDTEILNRVPFRNEVYLYNQICMMRWSMGQKEESIYQYKKLMRCFEDSFVDLKYHIRSIGVILLNMTNRMEKMDKGEETEYWSKFYLNKILCCGKGTGVETQISNLGCIYQKQGQKRELCLDYAKHTLIWCELFKYQYYYEITMKYIHKHFGDIEDVL